jgi:hypothetical protein
MYSGTTIPKWVEIKENVVITKAFRVISILVWR